MTTEPMHTGHDADLFYYREKAQRCVALCYAFDQTPTFVHAADRAARSIEDVERERGNVLFAGLPVRETDDPYDERLDMIEHDGYLYVRNAFMPTVLPPQYARIPADVDYRGWEAAFDEDQRLQDEDRQERAIEQERRHGITIPGQYVPGAFVHVTGLATGDRIMKAEESYYINDEPEMDSSIDPGWHAAMVEISDDDRTHPAFVRAQEEIDTDTAYQRRIEERAATELDQMRASGHEPTWLDELFAGREELT